MKNKTKIVSIIVIILVITGSIGGYYGYKKYNLDKKVQASDKVMNDKGIKQNDKDKSISDDILKNNNLEYVYITHNDQTVMLNLKFKSGIQDKDKRSIINKYMDKIKTQYKGKNINVSTVE